jgi:hypothetical protein
MPLGAIILISIFGLLEIGIIVGVVVLIVKYNKPL